MVDDTVDFPILIKMSADWSWLSVLYNTIICARWKSIFTLIQNEKRLYKIFILPLNTVTKVKVTDVIQIPWNMHFFISFNFLVLFHTVAWIMLFDYRVMYCTIQGYWFPPCFMHYLLIKKPQFKHVPISLFRWTGFSHSLHLKREIWSTSLTFRFLKLHLRASDDDVLIIILDTAVMLYFLNTHFRNWMLLGVTVSSSAVPYRRRYVNK